MCQFLSAIVMKNGDILMDPEHTDSHEDLIKAYCIRDNGNDGFVRVEFTPPSDVINDIENLDKWQLKVDEESTPDWFDSINVRVKLEEIIKSHIVKRDHNFLLGGWYILINANVKEVKNVCIKYMVNSKIEYMFDSSKINRMHGSSKIENMYDSSKINRMHGNSVVEFVTLGALVGVKNGNAMVKNIYRSPDYFKETYGVK